MKEVSKLASPVPVEVYSPAYFQANPTSSLYDALECVNGVRPQMNCSICNTGDIRIQGLEGPYTMVLIDGMPIVSGLGTVYGLNGIPSALIERMEVVKGAASTLYGSEAVGGLINVITKSSDDAPALSADVFGTTWGEITADVAASVQLHDKVQGLLGVNAFHFGQRVDRNDDQFTDMPLQDRVSLFNTWSVDRESDRVMTLGGRYIYEDRFGGDVNWVEAEHRGGSERYGESIYTHRWEAFGTYQLPTAERLMLQFSANGHRQNSVYGDVSYIAAQHISFGQLTWDKSLGRGPRRVGGCSFEAHVVRGQHPRHGGRAFRGLAPWIVCPRPNGLERPKHAASGASLRQEFRARQHLHAASELQMERPRPVDGGPLVCRKRLPGGQHLHRRPRRPDGRP